jgi:pSer/pThr/pTyr-binding forkhead associated (FHA) protein
VFAYLDRRAERTYMPVIKVDNHHYPLHPGQNRVGAGDDADVRVDGDDAYGIHAIVEVAGDAQAVIRRVDNGSNVRVNGIALVDPTPLIHGDKVEVNGKELLYADDTKIGNTAFISAADVASFVQKRTGPARATTATGGRLVSLVDGKEYIIPDVGISIGRDASAGVVVAQNEVSRKHAEVAPNDEGYEVRDFSANGVFVNGVRVTTSQLLARSDVIRIGTEEFRFYADVKPAAAPAPAPMPAPSLANTMMGMRAVPRPPTPATPQAAPSLANTMMGMPAVPRPATPATPQPTAAPVQQAAPQPVAPPLPPAPPARVVLATLEITNAGPTKGQTFDIHVPLAHVGRGAHNDIVLVDDSVSETHAKFQRREDGWYLVDVGSTNGTYVGGQRLNGERRLDAAPDVRFGGVKMVFRAREAVGEPAGGGTRTIAMVDRASLRQPAPSSAPAGPVKVAAPVAASAVENTNAPSSRGLPAWVWGVVALAVVAAVAFFLLNR